MDVGELLKDPIVTAILGAVGAGVLALVKRSFDLAQKHLELEAIKVTTQIEIVSAERKRLTGTATPTEIKRAIAKDHLTRTSPTLRANDATRIVEAVLPHTREIVRGVQAKVSQIPTGPGASGHHVIELPPDAKLPTEPPPIPRPTGTRTSNDHPAFGAIDIRELREGDGEGES